MSVYSKYLELKNEDKEKIYLFGVGSFYIFINEDAEYISKITTLKLVNHAKNVIKCGFPKNCLDKYLSIFNNLGLNIVVVNGTDENKMVDKYLEKTRNIDIDNITPLECFNIICELKKVL